jgi:hypothetical protein
MTDDAVPTDGWNKGVSLENIEISQIEARIEEIVGIRDLNEDAVGA